MPIELLPFRNPVYSALSLTKWYAREHVIFCLVPAFFIAGAISVFISQASVIKYFGAKAKKVVAYAVASISGTILAVCSCTVLPLFYSIYQRGAGLGPAISFLYSGPAINVLAIILTARILGWKIGLARAIGAILFSIVIGLLMHIIFIKDERLRQRNGEFDIVPEGTAKPLWKTVLYFLSMIGILIFANWAKPADSQSIVWLFLYRYKWFITGFFLIALILMLIKWFEKRELKEWVAATWDFAYKILPLLLIGVLIAGFFLGRPGEKGIIPSSIVERAVGGNSVLSNFFAAIAGAFMYFATLTEIPILEGLIRSGMGMGPALALLLAGPSVSLPSMLVIRNAIGTKKMITYVFLIIFMATITGLLFGLIA
jgi:uncharacterized membrane protein YraQ (UPF0718 family)